MSKPNSKRVSATLATATCALLGATPGSPVRADELDNWDFDSALLYYGEDGDRVTDASLSLLATRKLIDDRSLTLGLSVDALTGATPNGALQQSVPQTFTHPSGNSVFTTLAGDLPLDDAFRDTRVAFNAKWQQPLGRLYTLTVGGNVSGEYDYTHIGVNFGLSRDFNQRNTTLSAGLAYASDEFDPVGGTPAALSPMLDVGDLSNRRGAESKDILDVVLGVSQVINRNTILQFNYSYSNTDGYQTDPYRILSVIDGVSGAPLARVPTPGVDGPSHQYLFESRPDTRTKHSFYTLAKHYFGGKVLDVSYRYMTDDWEIDSHTVDMHLRWPLGARQYLEPHLRFYTQSAAEFYTVSLVGGQPLPAFASNDYRLGDFDAVTAGLKFGWKTRRDHDASVRLELYQQRGDIPSSQLVGSQLGQVSYPDLDAVIAQFSYSF